MIHFLLSLPISLYIVLATFSISFFIAGLIVSFFDTDKFFVCLALSFWPISFFLVALGFLGIGLSLLYEGFFIKEPIEFYKKENKRLETIDPNDDRSIIVNNDEHGYLTTSFHIQSILNKHKIYADIVTLPIYNIAEEKCRMHRNTIVEKFRLSFISPEDKSTFLIYWGALKNKKDDEEYYW
jgi:uncharacterized membrane protein YbaN (DUF454 family)